MIKAPGFTAGLFLQNVNGQIGSSPNAEPDCSKGASSNVCNVSASLDHLTIRANRGTIAVCSVMVLLILLLMHTGALQSKIMQDGASVV